MCNHRNSRATVLRRIKKMECLEAAERLDVVCVVTVSIPVS
jgi:hypothetical protein